LSQRPRFVTGVVTSVVIVCDRNYTYALASFRRYIT
jgi:hypothetical protein